MNHLCFTIGAVLQWGYAKPNLQTLQAFKDTFTCQYSNNAHVELLLKNLLVDIIAFIRRFQNFPQPVIYFYTGAIKINEWAEK